MAESQLSNSAQGIVQSIIDELTASGRETGLQVAAYLDGELVVDAWSGLADVEGERAMEGDTLVPSWSTGKGVAATLVAVLVDKGVLDYDATVGTYWPEFACRGKENTTLGQVLSHSAGLPQLPADVTRARLLDVEAMAEWLARQAPRWEPGTATGYHAWTFGILLAEIMRRATGRTCEELLRDELAGPLGIADSLLFGVSEQLLPRVATCYEGDWSASLAALPDDAPALIASPRAVLPSAEFANSRDYLRTALPANGTMSARAAARMYAALACGEIDGVRVVSEETLRRATTVRTTGIDRTFGFKLTKGYGFALGGTGTVVRAPDGGFGTNGSGGSTGSADPARRFSFALTKNRMSTDRLDKRLLTAVREALGIALA